MKKSMCIEKNVTLVALWYFLENGLSQYVEIVKCVADCMIWFKFDKWVIFKKMKTLCDIEGEISNWTN
jgi:hypothetical protein